MENMCSDDGWLTALLLVLMSVAGGLNHHATVCSSWVWMSRNSTGRSIPGNIGGFADCKGVLEGNCMTARVTLLLALASCKSIQWIVEQPASSLMHQVIVWLTPLSGQARQVGSTKAHCNNRHTAIAIIAETTLSPSQESSYTFAMLQNHRHDVSKSETCPYETNQASINKNIFIRSILERF